MSPDDHVRDFALYYSHMQGVPAESLRFVYSPAGQLTMENVFVRLVDSIDGKREEVALFEYDWPGLIRGGRYTFVATEKAS